MFMLQYVAIFVYLGGFLKKNNNLYSIVSPQKGLRAAVVLQYSCSTGVGCKSDDVDIYKKEVYNS